MVAVTQLWQRCQATGNRHAWGRVVWCEWFCARKTNTMVACMVDSTWVGGRGECDTKR